MKTSFWTTLEALVQSSELVIDRPKGSTHPRYGSLVYPLDYGYLKGTSAADGEGIDVWRGSLPGERLVAVVCTVDLLKRDAEIKLLLGCSQAEQSLVCDFHNSGHSMAAILLRREAG